MAISHDPTQARAGTSQAAVDGARLIRVLTDSQYVALADSFLRTLPAGADQEGPDVADVIALQSQAQDRLAGDHEFALDLARQLGEDRLAAEVGRAAGAAPDADAAFQDKLHAEGGVLAFVEKRLTPNSDTGAGDLPVGVLTVSDSHTACCVGGVLLIVGGAGVTIFGPKIIGPVAEIVGPAAVVVGIVEAASCC